MPNTCSVSGPNDDILMIELYLKLDEAEIEIACGAKGEDFFEFAKKLRCEIHGAL